MKTFYYLLTLSCFLGLFSCNDFLDVSSSEKVLQKDLFKNSQGIRLAVNGVYRNLSSVDLYGENLSWGFISALGHNYEINQEALPHDLLYAANFEWNIRSVETICNTIWSKSYNIIANCNNIIQEVETKDSIFFEAKEMEKNIIMGEMYGIRAMLHFDLLRLFSSAPIIDKQKKSIPYVRSYPDLRPTVLTTDEVLKNIIDDMEKSQKLLAPIDTIKLQNIMKSPSGRYKQQNSYINIKEGDFFNYRAQRMNFFASTGLLARIYLYSNDYDNAYKNAKLIYEYHKKNWFKWTSSSNQGGINNLDYIYIKRPEELLLTFSNNRNYDNYEKYTLSSGSGINRFRMNNMDILFKDDLDDFRYTGWYNRYGLKRYLTWMRPTGNSLNAQNITRNQGPLIPIIRFSEMFHILIECNIVNNNKGEAIELFNDLRINRGAKSKIPMDISVQELMNKLVNDIIRETLTEGQTFFMYKRLNKNIFNGETDFVMKPEYWTAPIPYSEKAY